MKKTYTTFLAFACITLIMGCVDKHPPVNSRPSIKFELMSANEANCSCQGAVKYKITNTGSAAGTRDGIRYSRILNQGDSAVVSQNVTITVQPKSSIPLECSLVADQNSDCVVSQTYQFNGTNYPNDISNISRDVIINMVTASIDPLPSDLSPTNSCLNACVTNNPSCQKFDASASPDAPLGKAIALLLGNLSSDQTIGVSKIMALTRSGQNECGRTDVVLKNNLAHNFGNRCDIRGILPGGAGSADVSVPSSMQFRYNQLGAGNFSFKFYKSGATPSMLFSDPTLQTALGGSIKQLNYHDGQFIMQHDNNNCFAITLKP